MPIHFPVVSPAPDGGSKARQTFFNITCAAVGAAAVGLAGFVDWLCYDRIGAALILLMASGLLAVLLRSLDNGCSEDRASEDDGIS